MKECELIKKGHTFGFLAVKKKIHMLSLSSMNLLLTKRIDMCAAIALYTITKNRFCYAITYETPRTDSDKHCDQLKGNV